MLRILLLWCLALPVAAQDSWQGTDKRWHFGFSVFFGVGARAALPDAPVWKPALACMTPGVLKELQDNRSGGKASWKDLGADALGCATGIAAGGWLVRLDKERMLVSYRKEW